MSTHVPNRAVLAAAGLAAITALAACNRQESATPLPTADVVPPAAAPATPQIAQMAQPDAQMQVVLDQLAALGAKPLETLTPEQARAQASPADAVKAVLEAQGKPTTPEAVASVRDSTFPGPAGPVPIHELGRSMSLDIHELGSMSLDMSLDTWTCMSLET
ncbi:MAG: hypothetical protein H0T88_11050 [Lysobacter sp.]|nr:hypothetical protein [Lysobacter sp.]